eukprot:gene4646-5804_t
MNSVTKLYSTVAVNTQRRGFLSAINKFLFPTERQIRSGIMSKYNVKPGTPQFEGFYSKIPQTQLSKDTGIPDALLDDPLLHISVIKYNKHIVERYNLSPEQEKELWENYEVSQGDASLEQHLPLPVPEHNFEELPIVKVGNF